MQVKFLLSLIVLFISLVTKAQTADEIINGYVKFIGGKHHWKKIKAITTSGEYNYGGIAFPFTAYSKRPNLYKFVVPFNGKYYAQAFDGTRGWKIDAFKNETSPTWLTGKDAKALANEADVELEDALINYRDKGHQAILEDTDSVQSELCFKIKFIRKNGDVETFFFKDKTFELVMKTGVSKNAELEGAFLNTFYNDYHDVEGIKIPFKAVSESNGQIILTITIKKAWINTLIEDKEFQP